MVTGVSVTVTVALAYLVLSTVEVAVTVRLVAVSPSATVSKPVALIVVSAMPSTLHATVLSKAPVPETVAVKFCVVPFCTLVVAGEITTPLMLTGISL